MNRRVLFVAHTMTSVNRLLDVVGVFDSDHRVAVTFTQPDESRVPDGVPEHLRTLGFAVVPWKQALTPGWDLAITANTSGGVEKITAPTILLSHGIGYTKTIKPETGNRKPETGNRKPETGNRKPETRNQKPVYGLSPESLLVNGRLVADVLGLSHEEQLDRLTEAVPEAAHRAAVIGDPRLDRMVASRHLRPRYRAALGVHPGHTLIVVSSTWWDGSLFGTWPDLIRQILAEHPVDTHRVAAILHPHIWYEHDHGPARVRAWLADCLRAGLILIPPDEGWAATLIAADLIVGDHGAVTCYNTVLDTPITLACFPVDDVAPGSPVDLLGRTAPRIDRARPLRAQLDAVRATHPPGRHREIAAMATSLPGKSASRLREVCYELLGLEEPPTEVPVPVLPTPVPMSTPGCLDLLVTGRTAGEDTHLTRHPIDAVTGAVAAGPDRTDAHLVADRDHPMPGVRGGADIVFTRDADPSWLVDALAAHPFAAMAVVARPGGGEIVSRDGPPVRVERVTGGLDALAAASALYLRDAPMEPPGRLTIHTGGDREPTVFRVTAP